MYLVVLLHGSGRGSRKENTLTQISLIISQGPFRATMCESKGEDLRPESSSRLHQYLTKMLVIVPAVAKRQLKMKCYDYNFRSLKERNEVKGI